MRLEARADTLSRRAGCWRAPFAAVAFTLLVSALLVAWAGAPVGRAYALLLRRRASARASRWSETLTRATPLILTGLAAAVAFRARLYNIGAEGPALCRRARRGGGRRAACGGARPAAAVLFPLMIAAGDGRGRAAAGRPGAAQDAARRGRGGDHAAAELHRAAVRVDDARRADEGPDARWAGRRAWPLPPELELGKLLERSRVHTGLLLRAGAGRWSLWVDRHATRRSASRCARVGANARAAALRRRAGDAHRGRDGAAVGRARRAGRRASRWPGAPATSRSTCRPATATAAS